VSLLISNKVNRLICPAPYKDSTEGFNCTAKDNLFQSDTVLGKNENCYESMRQDVFMEEFSDADLINLVERLGWSIGRATKL